MANYCRARVPGGLYFFTVVTAARQPFLTRNIDALRLAFSSTKSKHPFRMNAYVVLPEHMHCIWTLPNDDSDFSTRWRLIKSRFGHIVRGRAGMHDIWQPRFWEHVIRDDRDFTNHLDYIHYNPVKHDFVECPADWHLSSFHHYVKAGLYSREWAAAPTISRLDFE